MTVYVDDMRRVATVAGYTAVWSHLFADSTDELHEFAVMLGCRRHWVQDAGTYREHYDLTERRRKRAVELGAVQIRYPHGTAKLLKERKSR